MNILEVTHRFPPNTGGVERHVHEVSHRLARRGHEVTVLSADRGVGQKHERTDYQGSGSLTVKRVFSAAPGDNFHVAPQVTWKTLASSADVVHAHNYHSVPAVLAMLAKSGKKAVLTPHYHRSSANVFRDKLLSVYEPFGRTAFRMADEVLAVSEWEAQVIEEDFGVHPDLIPHGLDYSEFEDIPDQSTAGSYILAGGRLEGYKGVQHVIRAVRGLDIELFVVGDGPYKGELEDFAEEQDVADRVHFTGYVERQELLKFYAGAEVFLNLSTHEAFGMTVVESLASGTPVVVYPRRGLKDWVDVSGVVTTEGLDAYRVSDAIIKARGMDACETPLSTWDEVATEVEEVLEG